MARPARSPGSPNWCWKAATVKFRLPAAFVTVNLRSLLCPLATLPKSSVVGDRLMVGAPPARQSLLAASAPEASLKLLPFRTPESLISAWGGAGVEALPRVCNDSYAKLLHRLVLVTVISVVPIVVMMSVPHY